MPAPKLTVPAIHDWHLDKALVALGLAEDIASGIARCARCGSLTERASIGGILVLGAGRFAIVCHRPECLTDSTAESPK